jgi:hypothetical protein
VVREARVLDGRGNEVGGNIPVFAPLTHAPRTSGGTRHGQFVGLRLLRRGAPRNDMRARGRDNAARLGPVRRTDNAKQSQFAAGGIGGKACREKRLGEEDAICSAAETKPICPDGLAVSPRRASVLARLYGRGRAGTHDLRRTPYGVTTSETRRAKQSQLIAGRIDANRRCQKELGGRDTTYGCARTKPISRGGGHRLFVGQ